MEQERDSSTMALTRLRSDDGVEAKNRRLPAEKALTKGLGGGVCFFAVSTLIPPFLSVERNVSYIQTSQAYR